VYHSLIDRVLHNLRLPSPTYTAYNYKGVSTHTHPWVHHGHRCPWGADHPCSMLMLRASVFLVGTNLGRLRSLYV